MLKDGLRGTSIICIISVLIFLLCRVVLLDEFSVCGVALITVLMYRDRMNLYYILPMVLGYGSYYFTGFPFYGDAIATVIVATVFVILGNKNITLNGRIMIASIIAVTTNCSYFILTQRMYVVSILWIATEVLLIVSLAYVFNNFFSFVNFMKLKGIKIRRPKELGLEKYIGSVSATLVLALCGFGDFQMLDVFLSIPLIWCMLITLFWAFAEGIGAGVIAAVAVSIVLTIVGLEGAGLAVVLSAGAIAAGVFCLEDRFTPAVCFSGASLALGLLGGYPEFSINVFEPLIASVLFLLIPNGVMVRTRKVFSMLKRDIEYCELETKSQILDILGRYQKTFQRLANLYGNTKSNRSIISYQFRGMAQVTEKMKEDISAVRVGGRNEDLNKLSLRVAHSACGHMPGISGDSFEYKAVSNDEYGILISDGMGKGKVASAESSIAVSTLMSLISTGFEPTLALKTVNNILLQQGDSEVFSTIDLALIDKLSGNLRLFKIGAAATFIKHQGKVATVKMPTLPMGIVDGLHVDYVNVRLRPGDQVVMISDGVSDAKREDLEMNWLKTAIADIKSTDPQTVSDLIMNKAKENYGDRERDDMTVVTVVVA